MLFIDKPVSHLELPTRSDLNTNFGLLYGPSSEILSEVAWRSAEDLCKFVERYCEEFDPKEDNKILTTEGNQAFMEFPIENRRFEASVKEVFPEATTLGQPLLDELISGPMSQIIASISPDSPLTLKCILGNIMHKGDVIEAHEHEDCPLFAVLASKVPKQNEVPLIFERGEDEIQNIILPERSICIGKGTWTHHMNEVEGLRYSIGLMYQSPKQL